MLLLAPLFAAASLTCGGVKDVYRDNTCCGNATKAVPNVAVIAPVFASTLQSIKAFCDSYKTTCSDPKRAPAYSSAHSCEALVASYVIGKAGALGGDSFNCRKTHLGLITGQAAQDPVAHCPHAGPYGGSTAKGFPCTELGAFPATTFNEVSSQVFLGDPQAANFLGLGTTQGQAATCDWYITHAVNAGLATHHARCQATIGALANHVLIANIVTLTNNGTTNPSNTKRVYEVCPHACTPDIDGPWN